MSSLLGNLNFFNKNLAYEELQLHCKNNPSTSTLNSSHVLSSLLKGHFQDPLNHFLDFVGPISILANTMSSHV